MNRRGTGNNRFLKQYNETGILDLIRMNRAVSRAELTGITGLSATAIGAIVSSLSAREYIHETGIGKSKGGRRPVLIELKPRSYYSLGFDIDVNCIGLALVDITGETVYEDVIQLSSCLPEGAAILMTDLVSGILEKFSIDISKLLGIGISVPGMVDNHTHEVLLAPNLGWKNADIGSKLKNRFNLPVYVENEAMSSAICENWLGACQAVENFVCVNIKSGIGAGIFTDGRLYRGTGGSAGEVGHIVVDENGPRCGCGNYGCLETMASTGSIVEKARKMVRQGIDSSLNEISDADDMDIDCIVKAARNGDEAARGILLESARFLGIALSNLVNTLNPTKIVIGKDFVKYGDLVMDCIKSIVSSKALKTNTLKLQMVTSEIGEKSSTLGAAIIPLKALFGK